jgi:trehalose 6-phosphate phosphatase
MAAVTGKHEAVIDPDEIDAVIFDMDGVVTDTASVHAAAWKRMFDEFLKKRAEETGEPFEPFDVGADYRPYVDGKAREDGVRSFLESRNIQLPEGSSSDAPDADTVHGLGTRKNDAFLQVLRDEGARAFHTTADLVKELERNGTKTALISASKNVDDVLEAAGLADLFEVRVDGKVAQELGLPGKPDPAVFIEAARRVGATPERSAVVEDALAGVEAGRRGGFALVVGVDRTGNAEALREAGADVVVQDLAEVRVADGD